MRALRSWRVLLGTLALAGLPALAGAQPVGPEFQVNTYTTGTQRPNAGRAIAADASGNFIVVWESQFQDGSGFGVFGQRYDGDGVAQGDEFQVNTYTTGNQSFPSVTSDASGNFVVVWGTRGPGDLFGIFGQRYDAAGDAQGSQFRVNSYTTDIQTAPSVASDASGNFVVVWQSKLQDGSDYGVFGRRYDSVGMARGGPFRVNSYTTGSQAQPSVASDATGNFVVVWQSFEQADNYWGIFGQRYDNEGTAQGDEFRVSPLPEAQGRARQGDPGTRTDQEFPAVASDASGNFVVAWGSTYIGYSTDHVIFGRRYDGGGVPQGDEFLVGSNAAEFPAVASAPSGNFVVVWQGRYPFGDSDDVFGQRYDSAGARLGSEFRVNSYTTSTQAAASVASDASGDFLAVWQSAGGQDGSSAGVFGQRFDFAGVPSLSISDVSVKEGNLPGRASHNWAVFKVTLSAPSAQTVTLDYATANGSAIAPSDYAGKSGTLSLSPGQTSAVIAVRVKEDNVQENDETFFVNLSNPMNATIADGQGVGTILNDDP